MVTLLNSKNPNIQQIQGSCDIHEYVGFCIGEVSCYDHFFIEAMIHLTYVILYSVMFSIVNLKVTNTDDFTFLQAVLIIHIPARLRSFNIKDSSCFGNATNSLFGINCFIVIAT
jgi:hypothetical protein